MGSFAKDELCTELAAEALKKDKEKVTVAERVYVMNAINTMLLTHTYEQMLSKAKMVLL